MRITKDDCTGLIIDIQEKLFPHIYQNEEIAKNTAILIKGLQELNIPVLVTEQYTKGLGFTIPELQEIFLDKETHEKRSFSCCDDHKINLLLTGYNRKVIIIAGIEAHVCVLQTAIDLIKAGIVPVIVEDCVSSRKEKDKNIAIERMRQEGALITTYESVLFELTRYSNTDTFKKISNLVK